MYILMMLALSICYIGIHQVSSAGGHTACCQQCTSFCKQQQGQHVFCLTQQILGLLLHHTAHWSTPIIGIMLRFPTLKRTI